MAKLLLVTSLLLATMPAYAANGGKNTVAKERAPGTTSNAGNRCPGGTFDTCVQAVIRTGWKPNTATTHCRRTCSK